MRIPISIDIEDEIRQALAPFITTYCRPLPDDFEKPCILVTKTGGDEMEVIDRFRISLDSRADTEAEADETLRKAVGILKEVAALQSTSLRVVNVNSSGSWGADPVRPDICMCSASLEVIAHKITMEV